MHTTFVETKHYSAGGAGLRVLFFGAIHGDELCGPVAIRRVIERLEKKELLLTKGSVTFVPVANPKAYASQTRELKENLNRVFKKTVAPESYEEELANELCALVDQHDVLLDIHSSFVPAPSHVFVDYPTEDNMSFARALGTDFLVFDWPKVYESNLYNFPGWTTDRYTHEAGKIGLLVECGKHDDPIAEKRAEDAIIRTLEHFGLLRRDLTLQSMHEPKAIYMETIFQRKSLADSFPRKWSHLDPLIAGDVIAIRESGEKIVAQSDGYILFPKDYAKVDGEWFYLGRS